MTGLLVGNFIIFLISNALILLGTIFLFTWSNIRQFSGFFGRHQTVLTILLGVALLIFVNVSGRINRSLLNFPTGYHWIYLVLELLILYYLTTSIDSKWQLVTSLAVIILWYWITPELAISWPVIVGLLVACLFTLLLTRFRASCWTNRWLYIGSLFLFCTPFLVIANLSVPLMNVNLIFEAIAWLFFATEMYEVNHFLQHHNQLLQHYQQQADYDDLTRLKNFRAFRADLERVFNRAQALDQRYALYSMDIDHFKQINDTYGHLAGNQVLQQVAQTLTRLQPQLTHAATFYRTGGEEFALLMVDIVENEQAALANSQLIQQTVSALTFQFGTAAAFQIHLSIGEERSFATDRNYLDIYDRADQFLYTSKRAGRNAITLRGKTIKAP
jgi:diguanylate cyclase (GGDEF)-like protein